MEKENTTDSKEDVDETVEKVSSGCFHSFVSLGCPFCIQYKVICTFSLLPTYCILGVI